MSLSAAQLQLTSWAIKATVVRDKKRITEHAARAKKIQRIFSNPGVLCGNK